MFRTPNPKQELTYQGLTPDDAEQLAALYACHFKKPWTSSFFKEILESAGGVGVGAFDAQHTLVGFCLSRFVVDEGEILTLVVQEEMRRQGIAAELLSSICMQLEEQGVKKIFLEVHEKNDAALKLYQKFYFIPIGVRKNYYQDTEEMLGNAIVLQLFLNK